MKRVLSIAILLSTLSVAVLAQTASRSASLKLVDLQGRPLSLESYRGKIVLLNFWATWCPPCRAEMPDLIKYQKQYQAHGLQVIGITYPPEEPSNVRRFTKSMGVNYPIAIGTEGTKSSFSQDEALPMTVIIDREGKVLDIIKGILLPEEFDEKIKPLLRQSHGSSAEQSPIQIRGLRNEKK